LSDELSAKIPLHWHVASTSTSAAAAATASADRTEPSAAAAREAAAALVEALRPRQWTKNLLVFAATIFAVKVTDFPRVLLAAETFVGYCAASSAAYLFNDLVDLKRDRVHPLKCRRPLARGAISPWLAGRLGIALAAFALAIGAHVGGASLLLILGFLAIQVTYSVSIKHVVLLDVLAIATLFVLRATAGGVATDLRISPWLLLCTGLLALFLALSKRRAELSAVQNRMSARPALDDYSIPLLDQLIVVSATSTITSYALYTFTARDSKALMITIPFVLFGLFRYLLLGHREGLGEEPENILLSDYPLLLCLVSWIVTAAVVLSVA
jgi:4-hydroxybenzoate polyprenyltransferase